MVCLGLGVVGGSEMGVRGEISCRRLLIGGRGDISGNDSALASGMTGERGRGQVGKRGSKTNGKVSYLRVLSLEVQALG